MSHMDSTRLGCESNSIQNMRAVSFAIAAKEKGGASGLALRSRSSRLKRGVGYL